MIPTFLLYSNFDNPTRLTTYQPVLQSHRALLRIISQFSPTTIHVNMHKMTNNNPTPMSLNYSPCIVLILSTNAQGAHNFGYGLSRETTYINTPTTLFLIHQDTAFATHLAFYVTHHPCIPRDRTQGSRDSFRSLDPCLTFKMTVSYYILGHI